MNLNMVPEEKKDWSISTNHQTCNLDFRNGMSPPQNNQCKIKYDNLEALRIIIFRPFLL